MAAAGMRGHVLIAGATGIAGRAAVQHFTARGWQVTCTSRSPVDYDLNGAKWISMDLGDSDATHQAMSAVTGVTTAIYAAQNASFTAPNFVEMNHAMLRNFIEAVLAVNGSTFRQFSLMQGTAAYGYPGPLDKKYFPSKEEYVAPGGISRVGHDDVAPVQGWYWGAMDMVTDMQSRSGGAWSYTIWVPPLMVGWATGGPLNLLASLCTYATLCKESGQQLCYPGPEFGTVQEVVDARLLAKAWEWAATAEGAKNQTFNLTNGDCFLWENLFRVVANKFKLEQGPRKIQELQSSMACHANLWDAVVQKHGLQQNSLGEIAGKSWWFFDMNVMRSGTQTLGEAAHSVQWSQTAPVGHLSSTIKLRKAGFHDCIDTEEMLGEWIDELQRQKYFPVY